MKPTLILTCLGIVMIWIAAMFSQAGNAQPYTWAASLTAVILFIAALMNHEGYEGCGDDDDD